MSLHPKVRTALIGACTAALLTGSGLLALPAQAEGPRAPAAVAQRATTAEDAVRTFFTDYYEASRDSVSQEGLTLAQVRERDLTPELDEALTQWTSDHQADPVFRRNALPRSYDLGEKSQADNSAKVLLTMTWNDGTTTDTWYTVDVISKNITGLADTA
ncbi:hypothetical protein [Streptomyces sp. PvR034]|uniref:hypothetical protein n=1 Tax=Streptomyces sp. PvR034 TaxID=3156401 RepID=UPI003397588B